MKNQSWCINRLSKMSASEVIYRLQHKFRGIHDEYAFTNKPLSIPSGEKLSLSSIFTLSQHAKLEQVPHRHNSVALGVLKKADQCLDNIVDIFGLAHDFGNVLDWHLDPKTGKQWPKEFWSKVNIRDGFTYGGPKFVWETNRLYSLPILGLSYRATNKKKYADKFFLLIAEWLKGNHYPYGVNWTSGIEDEILNFTGGIGCDAVIITAASDSLDPVNFAGAISRKKGTIVVVGAVPTGFDREPHYYKKELQVKMSCSYGPGRYDPNYEDKGRDYPVAYVRWTENRNMQAFQDLIYTKRIDISYLTTHVFKLGDAPKAYDMMMAKSEPFVGILVEYNPQITQIKQKKIELKTQKSKLEPGSVGIGFIGAGSYAQSHLLPNIPRKESISRVGVMTSSSTGSRSVADRFGFDFCTSNPKDILEDERINTVFIASRHDSHAEYVIQSLKAGKHVFVEKPLCLTSEALDEISGLYHSQLNIPNPQLLMVGFNRRFSALTQIIKETFSSGPMAMNYRINSGNIPADSWIQDPEIGGGRIIGEVCHFVDLLTYINGSLPTSVYAVSMFDPDELNDILTISLKFKNGSIGNISYYSNGDKSLPKEHIEVFANGNSAILTDFRSLTIHSKGKKKEKKLRSQNKGQKDEVNLFLDAIMNGKGDVIPFEDIYSATLATFKIIESLRTGKAVKM